MQLLKLIIIGLIGGIVLASLLQLIYIFTGNEIYILLYNVDYIPVLELFQNSLAFGIIFHFIFCITSVLGLFWLLTFFHFEYKILPYIFVYTIGAAILYFLSMLTSKPPDPADIIAWLYWTISHLIYGIVVSILIKNWLGHKENGSHKQSA